MKAWFANAQGSITSRSLIALIIALTALVAGPASIAAATVRDSNPTGVVPKTFVKAATAPVRMHYTANEGSARSTTIKMGYTLHDTTMSTSIINSLPAGHVALAYAGGGKCPSTTPSAAFKKFVTSQAKNPKLWGFYLSDEPSGSSSCVKGVRAMADYVWAHAPAKRSFIVVDDVASYAAYAPSRSHVTYIGLDPYPCSHAKGCDFTKIPTKVNKAIAAGIPRANIVPVYQTFGNSYYAAPSPTQLSRLLAVWKQVVPTPRFDYAYSWGCQTSLTQCLSKTLTWQRTLTTFNRTTTVG